MRPETEKVIAIVRQAGEIALKYFEQLQDHHISTKDDGSLLTIADTEVDAYLRAELEREFPQYSVLSEESENVRTTEGVWIVDPIDATRNFAAGNPYFAVSVGLAINGQTELGVVYAPARDELYVGERGGQAFLNGTPIHVSDRRELLGARILLDRGVNEKTKEHHALIEALLIQEGAVPEQRINCAALDLCAVAEGVFDAFIHYRAKGWDIAAGVVVAEAAGAVVCHLDGTAKDLFEPGTVATNAHLKDALVVLTTQCI